MAIRKVLLADDSATDLLLLETIVSKAGYLAITATSGEEAVTKAKSEHPDAVMLDIMMKGMDGFEACHAITTDPETETIPVVLVSCMGRLTDKIRGVEQGARGYIVKPYTREQILHQLNVLGYETTSMNRRTRNDYP
jgi:twitching motility two-component system response regulator PilH